MRRTLLTVAVLLLLPLVATAREPAGSKKLTKADKKLQARINLAIRKGARWLESQQRRDGSFPYRTGGEAKALPSGGTALALLTLLHCGVKPSDRSIRKGFDYLRKTYEERKTQPHKWTSGLKVYETAVTVMALAQLGTETDSTRKRRGKKRVLLEESDRRWMQEMTTWLVGCQQANGGFGYYPYGGTDESNSQYAMLALAEARRMKLKVPSAVFEKAFDYWKSKQEKDGPKVRRHIEKGGDGVFNAHRTVARISDRARGWGYRGSAARGSMTVAGIAVMAIVRGHLKDRKRRRDAERSMYDGMAWVGRYFSAAGNPKYERYHYYYLYGLERAGVLGGVVYVGAHRWYAEGARYLVDVQAKDGSWVTKDRIGMGVVDPCFALLFLVRSTTKSYGVTVTPAGPVSLEGGDKLPPGELDELFQDAFAGMFRLGQDLRKARAREFTKLGPRVIGILLPKLQDPEEVVRDRAVQILRSITGKQMGYKPAAAPKEREAAIARWTNWYRANRRSLAIDAKSGLIAGASEASQIATGSVGESGASKVLTLRIKGSSKQVVVLHNCESSLCGNTGAVAQLIVNGKPMAQGRLTKVGASLKVDVQPGDRVVATVNTIPLDNGIVCVRLGELHFVLEVRAP